MDLHALERVSEAAWRVAPAGQMRVPAIIYGTESLVRDMDDKVLMQTTNVATLPGIVTAAYAMPDAHWGYGFPIGGVAAFDPDEGGVISAGGVGFDISCGVRAFATDLPADAVVGLRTELANAFYHAVPVGVGSTGTIALDTEAMDAMLRGGARWAVEQGYGVAEDLERIEEYGCMAGADPARVSAHAKHRQREELGTLGSGNHYLEVQRVAKVFDPSAAEVFGVREGTAMVSFHCGSRGLGHQIGTEFLKWMWVEGRSLGVVVPDRELACAPIRSEVGQAYLGAMRAGINCALANRQVITHLAREVWARFFPHAPLQLVYDVSHNTCKVESHMVDGRPRMLFVHRKGATRAFGPSNPELPPAFRGTGQPVLVGGTMGTASYLLVGTDQAETLGWSSSCHGAGRAMSRHSATRQFKGRSVVDQLAAQGIEVRAPSLRGIAEEAPGAYKDVTEVVDAAAAAGLSRKVARLEPIVCIKG